MKFNKQGGGRLLDNKRQLMAQFDKNVDECIPKSAHMHFKCD